MLALSASNRHYQIRECQASKRTQQAEAPACKCRLLWRRTSNQFLSQFRTLI